MKPNRGWSVYIFSVFFAVALLSAAGEPLWSQALTGDILGTVSDSSGALVSGAKVTLTQVDTGVKFTTLTGDNGNYIFAELKPSSYRLEVSRDGFQTAIVQGIELLVTQRQRIDVTLGVGSVSQQVQVTASVAQLLETQASSIDQVIQATPIVELPLNGRNFIQLASLTPGMYPIGNAPSVASNWTLAGQGGDTISALGLRESNVSYLIDGVETRGARWGNVTIRPSPDAIQEFKMQTADYSADNGRSSVIVNIDLKSGSDKVHGSAFEFIRNTVLDANDYFLNSAGEARQPFQQNDFGFSLGGPMVMPHFNGRRKAFFFADYEGIRSRLGEADTGLYPSAAQLQGNLADDSAGTGIFPTSSPFCQANPSSGKCLNVINPSTGQPFPGNVIPTNMLDPVSQHWIPYIRVPNIAVTPNQATAPAFNFAFAPKNMNDDNQFHVRTDQILGPNDQLYESFSFDDRPHFEPGLAVLGGVSVPWRAQVLAINETHTFSPTVVNEFRFGYFRNRLGYVAQTAYGPNIEASDFGLANVNPNPITFGVPLAGISGFSCIGSAPVPMDSLDQNYQFVDNLTVVRGKHDIRIGGSVFHEKFFYVCDCAGPAQFTFGGQFSGSSLGDFLLGEPYSTYSTVGQGVLNARANYYAAYMQDDIRARTDLTINLGIRYEIQQNPRDINGDEETFDIRTQQESAVFRGQVPNGISPTDYHDVAPRVGFAYSPRFLPNTVIRGSFGIFYSTDNWNEFGFAAFGPDFIEDEVLQSNPVTPTLFMKDLLPPFQLGIQNVGPSTGLFSVSLNNIPAYVQEWNFDVQRTIGKDWLVDIGYTGNIGQHLLQRKNANTPAFDPTGTIPIQQRVPDPNINFDLTSYSGGWSSFSGLLAKVQKRVTENSFLLVSYTYSKGIDLGSYRFGSYASRDFKVYDRGNSDFMVPQELVASYVYELPFGRGKRFLPQSSGLLGKLDSGWRVNGIVTFAAGQYGTPVLGSDWANLGAFSKTFPDVVTSPIPAHQSIHDWVNKSAFALPGCPTLSPCPTALHIEGDGRRNNVEDPGRQNWDLALVKETSLTERLNTEFRAEFFNAWNHPQFAGPNFNLGSPAFGQISSQLIPPREIQIALKLLW